MSLEPQWYSTIYGLLFIVYQALAMLTVMIGVTTWLSKHEPLASVATEKHFHDLGKLTHGFVVFWIYGTFSQFLIMWSGNLPEEIVWYVRRTAGGWKAVAIFLVFFHFVVPFFLLLSRNNKMRKKFPRENRWSHFVHALCRSLLAHFSGILSDSALSLA